MTPISGLGAGYIEQTLVEVTVYKSLRKLYPKSPKKKEVLSDGNPS